MGPLQNFTIEPDDSPNRGLCDGTVISGQFNALQLFGIAPAQSTWASVKRTCRLELGVNPLWIDDLETAVDAISRDETPAQTEMYCVARSGGLYRPVIWGYVPFQSGKKEVHVLFVPARQRSLLATNDGGQLSEIGLLLGAMIFVVRFRQNLLPMAPRLEKPNNDFIAMGSDIDRSITKMEQEAEQLGFTVKRDPESAGDSSLLDAIRDELERKELLKIAREWRELRVQLITAFRPQADGGVGKAVTKEGAETLVRSVLGFLKSQNPRSATLILHELTKRLGEENESLL
jgi:hypothetical protein